MDTQTQRTLVELDLEIPGDEPDGQSRESDAARSERNIATWMSYLPPPCVNSMIAMGWDITT
jgi:hypothetical protein